MNLSTILTAATEFAQTPLGLSLAGFLGVLAIIVAKKAHVSLQDVLSLKDAIENVSRDATMAPHEASKASTTMKKTASDVEKYLNVVGNGGSKLKKIVAAIKLFLK